MIINRMLTKRELTRLYRTGETYVYCYTGSPSFASASNWSCVENTCTFAPGGAVGVAYIVENGQTMTQGGTATFGGSVDKKVSLTLGRKAELSYLSGNTTITKTVNGNFNQNSAGTLTFYDLRFVQGTWTAAGTGLTTTLLDVDTADNEHPYVLNVTASTYTLNAGGAVTGDGVLKKSGSGKLVLNGFTAATGSSPKLRLSAGSLKAASFDGYEGGTVLVNTTSPVAFTGNDSGMLPTAGNKMQLLFDGTVPTVGTKCAVMTVPSGLTAEMFNDTTTYANGVTGVITVENNTVYVTPKSPAPHGAVIMFMGN